jgi:diguanylate cyclase (GGDEF)-like protein/PAS domain S-box-containing protein
MDLYKVLAENSMDVVMFHRVGGVLKWISPTVTNLLGWAPEELVGRTSVHLWHPDDLAAEEALRDQVDGGRPGRGVFRLRAKDGRYVWIETSLQPFVDEDGASGAVGSMRDVTAHVESDKARLESEDRFRLTMENAMIGMCLVSPTGRFVLVNPALCEMLGRDAERLATTTWPELTHPDDVATDDSLVNDLAAGRIPSYRLRKRYLKPDGSVLWGDLSVSCVRNEDGSVRYFISQIVDVTDRVLTERALAESERHYRALVDGAAEAIFEAAPDHRVTWMSPAVTAILGWAPEELVGTAMADLLAPEDRLATAKRRAGMFAGKVMWDSAAQMRMRTKTGQYRWVSLWAKPVIDETGSISRVVSGIQDIDELMTIRIRLQATLDTEFDPHVLLEAIRDDAGSIVDFVMVEANPASCEYIGRARADVVGRHLMHMPPDHLGTELVEMFRHVVDTGEPLRRDHFVHTRERGGRRQVRLDIQAAKMGDGLSCTWRDVTERDATAEALAASAETYRLLAENLSDVVIHLRDGVVAWVAPSLATTLHWAPEDWVDRRVAEFVHPDDLENVETARANVYAGKLQLFRARARDKDGTYHWVQVHAKPYYDRDGNQDGIVASCRVIDPEVAAEAELEWRARSDELTGLMNRREALERVAAMTGHPRRTGEEAAVLFCDIDGFKTTNDKYGHYAGDAVLLAVAARVTACLRTGDIAARIGGDELLVLLDGVHDLDDAVAIAEKIRRTVAEPVQADGHTLTTTLSIGVTLAVPGESVDAMIARADEAMYQAKQAGGDHVIPAAVRAA